jgi:manganese-dependent inorganic pyrophosphatase
MEFDIYCKRLKTLLPKLPVLVVGKKRRHLEYAIENQFPAIILTGLEKGESLDIDYSNFKGIIYQSYEDTAETIRLLRMSLPVHQLLQKEPPHIQNDELFDDAKRMLAESEFRGLPVFEESEFIGFVTRRCFLEKPRRKVIMVDHNELDQSVEGLEEAEIIEIIDHHRLDAEKTTHPIFIAAEPVGSTCTIVYHQYLRWSVAVDRTTAKMLVAGIIADTVILKSPTTTPIDVAAVKALSKIAQIDDIKVFGEKLFAASSVLTKADPAKVISADFKNYDEKGVRFGIGQVEVTTLEEIDEVKSSYAKELALTKQSHGLDWAMLLITDVIKEESVLMTTSYPRKEKAIAYPVIESGMYLLKGVLSRKKQLLPEIIRVLEEVS